MLLHHIYSVQGISAHGRFNITHSQFWPACMALTWDITSIIYINFVEAAIHSA